MHGLTTHVLDTERGVPAAGVCVVAEKKSAAGHSWVKVGEGATDADGRISKILNPDFILETGIYRLIFETEPYFQKGGRQSFYPEVQITFEVTSLERHHHVPLLISGFGFSTYRGS